MLKLTSYHELIYLHFPQKKKFTFTIFSFFVDKFYLNLLPKQKLISIELMILEIWL